MEKRKENYFGSAEISKNAIGIDVLTIDGYFSGSVIVWDSEIKDNENSPEVSSMEVVDEEGINKISLFIHKKDCLQLANFLLNIHTEYTNRMNRIELNELRQSSKFPE